VGSSLQASSCAYERGPEGARREVDELAATGSDRAGGPLRCTAVRHGAQRLVLGAVVAEQCVELGASTSSGASLATLFVRPSAQNPTRTHDADDMN